MNNLFLYVVTVLIWGSTWLGIKFQLGSVDPLVSVIYRFCLASLILMGFCKVKSLNMRFRLKDHFFMALLGAMLFGFNYWFFYISELYITSGLAAVVFSTIVVMNILNSRLFLGTILNFRVAFGALFGLLGIGLVFWPELKAFSFSDNGFTGLVLAISATLFASFGNIISARNQKRNLPVVQINAFGMAYGAFFMAMVAIFTGKTFSFSWSFSYIASLAYLAFFGTVIAFGTYLTLLGRIGPNKAAYSTLLFPLVALGLSTIFEDYVWTVQAVTGVCMILLGNLAIIQKPKKQKMSDPSPSAQKA